MDAAKLFRITHPFHPLLHQEFEFIDCRKCWGEVRVFYYASNGQLAYIPERWTTLQAKDPFVEVANGRTVARAEDLLSLAQVVNPAFDTGDKWHS